MNDYIKSDLMRYYGKYDKLTFFKAIIFNRTKKYIQLPKTTKVGYGLYIGHGGPIVVNSSTIIGNNCNLSQFTTIGSNEGKAKLSESEAKLRDALGKVRDKATSPSTFPLHITPLPDVTPEEILRRLLDF